MPYTHRTLMPLLLALGLTHCAPPLSEPVEEAQSGAEEVEAQWGSSCPSAWLVEDSAEGPAGSSPLNLLDVDGRLFYSADDGIHGREPWRSEGTRASTRLIEDIVPGAAGSSPSEYVDVHGRVFFSVRNELWMSDGTPEGTVLVKDIRPGVEGSGPDGLTVVGDRLYFSADDGEHGRELWRSDGTEEGTELAADVRTGPEGSAPLSLVRVNKRLYFSADDGVHGREPWKLDGGRARLVADIARGAASSISTAFPPDKLVRSGELLYAIADDGIHGEELWALPLSSDACRRSGR